MTGFESWIDRQIREAEERGEFDNLPGAGKPIEGLDRRQDPDWWVKGLMAREHLFFVLPTSLALRKEVEALQETLASEWSEPSVREIVVDLNARVVDARRPPVSGPPVYVKTVDVEQAVTEWREARQQRRGGRPPEEAATTGTFHPAHGQRPRRLGWLHPFRRPH